MRHLTALYTAAFWKVVFAVLLLALLAPATAGAGDKKVVEIQILNPNRK